MATFRFSSACPFSLALVRFTGWSSRSTKPHAPRRPNPMNNSSDNTTIRTYGVPSRSSSCAPGGAPRSAGPMQYRAVSAGNQRVPRIRAIEAWTGTLLLLLAVVPAYGVGQVVTDPGAYTHQINAIKALNDQITEMRKSVETLGGIKTVMQ